ncbi:MAG: toxin-activating lysine-acyltransferase, partial [Sneathiella sp.]
MLQSKRLEIDFSQKAAVLGEIAWLYSQTEATRSQPFSDLAELAEGPLRCGQYRIYRKANVPVGFVAWAQLSEIAEKKVALNSYRLTHDMWNSGNRIWLTTIISNSVKHSDVVEKTKLIFDKKYQFKGQI